MEKLKNHFNEKSLALMATALKRSDASFPERKFLRKAVSGLKQRELKERVQWVAGALRESLPEKLDDAYSVILSSIKSPGNEQGISGFLAWPFTQFVEDFGLHEPELSLRTLKELTKVMSAEFAIRPFLKAHQQVTLEHLKAWVSDDCVHVRRLVSEGTRPRLPWGARLTDFQRDPEICAGFLRSLRGDPELYVRKSVANHLNDFSKDHPDWLVRELAAWKKEFPSDPRIAWILRHSTRTLVKQCHPGALRLLGFRQAQVESPRLELSPREVTLGASLEILFSAQARRHEKWLIDYAVHHRKSNGALKPKMFKWKSIEASPGERIRLARRHKFLKITTREYYPGDHALEIFVNGLSVARRGFRLLL